MASIPSLLYGDLTIPAAKAINAAASPRNVSVAAERSVIPLVYGEDRINALIVNVLPAGLNSPTLLVQCLWCYAGDSVNDVRLNDKTLPAGSTTTHYTGSQSTADAALVSAFSAQGITYTDTLNGFMYSVIAIPTASFDGQLSVSARIRGRLLYDPRQDSTAGGSGSQRIATPSTWTWSDNPALAESDFLRSTVYGLSRTVDQSTVITCANACDALIGSPNERRRIVGVTFSQPASGSDIAEALRAYAGCFLLPGPNGIKLLADVAGSSVASYLHASGSIAAISDLQRSDIGNIPTAVEVQYTDTSQIPWRDGVAVASLAGAGTTRPWRLSQIKLPGIKRYSQAFREATERLAKLSTNDISCTLDVFDVGITHEQGDIVTVTHPVGIAAMTLRVATVEMPLPGRWRLRLVQYSGSAYSTATPAAPGYGSPGFTNPDGLPENVTGLSASGGPGAGRITWTPSTSINYRDTELRLGVSWAAGTFLARISGSAYPWNIATAGTYTVWAKHYSLDGRESASATNVSVTVDSAGVSGATSDIFLVTTGAIELIGNTARKTTSDALWNASVHSREAYIGGCFASAVPTFAASQVFFGINTDPASNANYTSIDYTIRLAADNNLYAFQAGTILNSGSAIGSYLPGDVLMVSYYGGVVRWHKNGAVLFQVTDTSMVSSQLFFDSSFYDGTRLERIRFGPLSPDFWNTLGGKPTDPELLNSYQIIGQNLLPESDQMVSPKFALGYTANGAVFDSVGVAYPESPGGPGATFQLGGNRSKLVYVRQVGTHTGSSDPDHDGAGRTVAGWWSFKDLIDVQPGVRVCYSLLGNGHRCRWRAMVKYIAADKVTAVAYRWGNIVAEDGNLPSTLSALQTSTVAPGDVPAGAALAQVWIVKYNTISGADSYVFYGLPQYEVVAANATGRSPYNSGPVAVIGTDQISAGAATQLNLGTSSTFGVGVLSNAGAPFDFTTVVRTETWTNSSARSIDVHVIASVVKVAYSYNGSPSTVTWARVSAEYSVSSGGGSGATVMIDTAPPSAVVPGDAAPSSGSAQFKVTVPAGRTVTATITVRHANTTSASMLGGEQSLSITALKL